jgi:hypothetical protein
MNLTAPWKASTDTPVNGVSAKLEQIRSSISEQADSLSDVASSYGSEAGSQAGKIAAEAALQARKIAAETTDVAADVVRDPVGSASGFFQSLFDAVASFITALTATGRKTAAELGQDAQAAASELRKVRITTEPKKTGPDFMPGIALLGGFGAGVALMYFFDPERGKGRRNMLRDRMLKLTRVTQETVQGKTKDLSNRAQGAAIEARKSLKGVMAGDQTNDSELQGWTGEANQPSGYASADPSTTDTWGEQPQPSESDRNEPERIEIT